MAQHNIRHWRVTSPQRARNRLRRTFGEGAFCKSSPRPRPKRIDGGGCAEDVCSSRNECRFCGKLTGSSDRLGPENPNTVLDKDLAIQKRDRSVRMSAFRKSPSSLPDIFLCFLIVEAFQGGGIRRCRDPRPFVPDGGCSRIGLDVLTLFVHLAEVQTSVGVAGGSGFYSSRGPCPYLVPRRNPGRTDRRWRCRRGHSPDRPLSGTSSWLRRNLFCLPYGAVKLTLSGGIALIGGGGEQ